MMSKQPSVTQTPDTRPSTRNTILLIDDEVLNHHVIKMGLDGLGYRLLFAFGGRQGIELALQEKPDLILLDVKMPVMDGFETCRALKATTGIREVPVIFLTAMNESTEKVEGFAAGGIDYIVKPFDEAELRARIRAHLEQYREMQAIKEGLHEPRSALDTPATADLSRPSTGLSARQVERATKAREMLIAQMAHPPSLEELACELGCGAKKLNRDFKALFGQPAQAWLREYRLRESRRLLRETDLPIEHIAAMMGYSSQSNFSTAFKRSFQITPRDFRKNMCK